MKHEIGCKRLDSFKENWPGQYDYFSHYEYLSGIPQTLFLITTRKNNGKTNACYHSWSAFSGDGGGYFVIMPGLGTHTHTVKNIIRDKEFCINFLSPKYDKHCFKTIRNNDNEVDEIEVAGLTVENAKEVTAPRIKEAFLTFECNLESINDISGKGITTMIIGRVLNAAIDESHKGIEAVCENFNFFVHAHRDPATGKGKTDFHATLKRYLYNR
jgi:flavin reductase (DIM6/NTAB) family NADH-FMN oxidoreductase RutF